MSLNVRPLKNIMLNKLHKKIIGFLVGFSFIIITSSYGQIGHKAHSYKQGKEVTPKAIQTSIFLDNSPWPMYCHDPKHTSVGARIRV